MSRHRSLTGPAAIHPFAFISDTDPSIDAANGVGPGKAWILESAPYTMKVRNEANDGWITVLGAPSGITLGWATKVVVVDALDGDPGLDFFAFETRTVL
jgi:hypothetical protein